MAGKFLKAYLWPIAAIAAYVLVAIAWHGWGYARALWRFLDSPEWWAENTYAVILFTVLAGVVVNIAARQRQRHEREPYEGWTVTVVDGDRESTASLDWEEVRRFENSPLEERRFIQSVLSSQGEMVKTRKLDLIEGDGQPQHAWVRKDKGRRRYVIDLAALRQSEDHAPDR